MSAMKLDDLVTILRTEARNQRTPPIDYVVAEDGGRMVHQPEPDIAMAELLEEAATALAAERAAREKAERERVEAFQNYVDANEALIDAKSVIRDFLSWFSDKPDAGQAKLVHGLPGFSLIVAARRVLEGGKNDE